MKTNQFLLFALSILIINPVFSQDKKIIKVPFYTILDTTDHGSELFYLQEDLPSLSGIPESLDTFMVFACYFNYNQLWYEKYQKGKMTKEEYLKLNTDEKKVTRHPIKYKVHAVSGFKGDKKIVIVDTNNNGSFLDERLMEFKAEVTVEEIFSEDNWSPFLKLHFEEYYDNTFMKKQRVGKIDPYIMKVNSVDTLMDRMLISFRDFEHEVGILELDGNTYLLKTGRRGGIYSIQLVQGDDDVVYPEIYLGQSLPMGNSMLYFEAYDIDQQELTIVKLNVEDLRPNEFGGLVGMKAPNIKTKDIDGNAFDLNSKQGKMVLLEFWGTWCGPCKADHPALEILNKNLKKNNIELIGIIYDRNEAKAIDYVKEHNLDWQHVFIEMFSDIGEQVTGDFLVSGYPTYILIDEKGIIRFRGSLEEVSGFITEMLSSK